MYTTLNSATAGGQLSFPDFVALASRHNFAAVEFDLRSAQALGLEPTVALLLDHRVFPTAFGLPVEWRKDQEQFERDLELLPALAKFAQDIDCTRCCTWVAPERGHDVATYASESVARLVRIAKILAENGVRLGLEFLGPHQFRTHPASVWFYNVAGALAVADEINAEAHVGNVGLLVDSFHWHTAGDSAMDLASIPLEQIVHVHINDGPAGLERHELKDMERELPGATGTIDITGFLTTLNGLGYDGPVAVETFSASLNAMTPDEAAALAFQSVATVLDRVGVVPLPLRKV